MQKYHNKIATHRCEGSLDQGISIRFCDPYHKIEKYSGFSWWLFHPEYEPEWFSWYLRPICPIKVCPFCGEVLEPPEKQV